MLEQRSEGVKSEDVPVQRGDDVSEQRDEGAPKQRGKGVQE